MEKMSPSYEADWERVEDTAGVSVGGGSVGHVLDLIRRAGGLPRAEIIEKSGLSRTTVAARLEALQAAGLISSGQSTAARGRPPSHFHFRADQGALLIAEPAPPVCAPRSPISVATSETNATPPSTSRSDPKNGWDQSASYWMSCSKAPA